jgi:hypothetical protein
MEASFIIEGTPPLLSWQQGVTDQPYRELPAGQVTLYQRRLAIRLDHPIDLLPEP